MRINANDDDFVPGWRVIDMLTGDDVPEPVIWADDVTGEYEVAITDQNKMLQHDPTTDEVITERRVGQIALVPPKQIEYISPPLRLSIPGDAQLSAIGNCPLVWA